MSTTTLLGLQILRGAIAQQHRLNAGVRQNKMPIRLLIANTGQCFQYGARNRTAPKDPYMTLFYETANAPTSDPRDPYAQFTQDFAGVFGHLSADADAAGGFDTVGIVSKVIENLLPASTDVQPNDIYLWLTAHGVSRYPGASGVPQLDGRNK